jgi:hypothetical protein
MATKRTKGLRFSRAIGKPCPYCKRAMGVGRSDPWPSEDHVHPRSMGGVFKVWCCSPCNGVKADMTLPEWEGFMASNPKWWEARPRG